jgi:TatD DNase family protein
MKLIDSHAHLDFEDFHGDFDAVLRRAEEAGVAEIINIGASLERSRASITLAENYNNIFAVVGVHPEEAENVDFVTIHAELMELAKSSRRVVGIGETGLDFYSSSEVEKFSINSNNKTKQKKLFQIHIDVARHLSFPLVVHIRNGEDEDAVNEAYEILKKSGYCKGVIHCFTLNAAWAKRFTDLGFYLGFTGIITYKNADEVRDAVSVTSLDRILVETDAPFLAPQKYRGGRNEPAYVTEIATQIAEIKSLPLDKVARQTTINVEKLFNI